MTEGVTANDDLRATFEAEVPFRRVGRPDELDGVTLAPGVLNAFS